MTSLTWRALAGLATVITIAFSLGAVTRPELALPAGEEVTAGVEIYAQAAAVRSMSLGAVTLWLIATNHRALSIVLTIGGLVQLGDAAISAWNGTPTLLLGAIPLAVVLLLAARRSQSSRVGCGSACS